MKKLLILVMAAMTTMTASAQIEDGNWYVTPKVGVSVADMTSALFNSKQAEVDYNADLKPIVSFTAGADFEYGLADQLGLAFGLTYARQGCKTKDDLFKIKLDYLNIPITFNYYPIANCGLAIKAGVQPGFLLSSKWGDEDMKDYNETFDLSIPLGLSYEFSDFVIDARYNLGITDVAKSGKGLHWESKAKNSVIMLTLGYKIPL